MSFHAEPRRYEAKFLPPKAYWAILPIYRAGKRMKSISCFLLPRWAYFWPTRDMLGVKATPARNASTAGAGRLPDAAF